MGPLKEEEEETTFFGGVEKKIKINKNLEESFPVWWCICPYLRRSGSLCRLFVLLEDPNIPAKGFFFLSLSMGKTFLQPGYCRVYRRV